jgi:hypothetical protein
VVLAEGGDRSWNVGPDEVTSSLSMKGLVFRI